MNNYPEYFEKSKAKLKTISSKNKTRHVMNMQYGKL